VHSFSWSNQGMSPYNNSDMPLIRHAKRSRSKGKTHRCSAITRGQGEICVFEGWAISLCSCEWYGTAGFVVQTSKYRTCRMLSLRGARTETTSSRKVQLDSESSCNTCSR
jgi:hypothetical protein